MKYRLVLWLTLSVVILEQIKCFNISIVEEYFNLKRLVATTIFACSTEDYMQLVKQLLLNYQYVASGLTYLNENSSFTNLMRYPNYKLGVYLDYTCDFGKKVLLESSKSYLFNGSYVWFIRINSTDEIYDFEDFNFRLDSDILLAVDPGDDKNTVELYDLYKINSTSSLITTTAGFYNIKTGLSIKLNGSMIQRRRDFKGFTFNSAIVTIDSTTDQFTDEVLNRFMDNSIEPESDALSKCAYTYCTYLKKMYNFTLNIHRSQSYGYPNQKGPILHDGLIGAIESKQIDFGLSPVSMIIKTRMNVAQFTLSSLWNLRMVFMFCHPSTLGTYKALIVPFSTEVWVFVICLTFAIGLILTVVKYFSIDNPVNIDQSLSGNIIITIGALYQQGLPSCSYKIPERIILLFTLILGVMIVAFYNSMIVTSLLQPPMKYITTPTQLLESRFKLILQNHSYPKELFGRATNPLMREMYEKVKKGPGYLKPAEGLSLVQKSMYAYFVEESTSYYIIGNTFYNREICQLQEIEVERPFQLYLPLRRNSPLLEFFNHGLLLMKETGIIQRMYKKWHPQKPECQGNLSIPSLEIQSLLVAYAILISGMCISLLILAAELAYAKYTEKQNNDNIEKHNKSNRRCRFNKYS